MRHPLARFLTPTLLDEISVFLDSPQIILSPSEIHPSVSIPLSWREVLLQQETTGLAACPPEWTTLKVEMPHVLNFLESNVLGTAILLDNDINPSLLYGFTVNGEFRFYWGQPPLEHSLPSVPEMDRLWSYLPLALRNFYTSVHNGWTCFHTPMNSMGPLPLQECFFLSEARLIISNEMATALPFNPSEVLAVFSNGMGDYLCLDTHSLSPNGSAKGVIWWHEKPTKPWVELDFWTVMREWMSIYFETADAANT